MELFNQLTAGSMHLVQGRIVNIGKEGKLRVKTDETGARILCDFLQTSAGPLPVLYLGTPVLCIVHESKGYVLGVIKPYIAGDDDQQEEQKQDPRQFKVEAAESIELTCGQSTLSMDKNGKIVLRGADITTRAFGANKIKGSSVRIN
jgi:hypothetical protein